MSKKSLLLNRTLLIRLVSEKPAIWDKTMKIYKNKQAKSEAWRDICIAMIKNYERMDQNRKNEYLKLLIRVWTHIRDSWMRSMKDKRNEKTITKPYIYHEEMLFLKKILILPEGLETIETADDIGPQEDVEEEGKELEDAGKHNFSIEEPDTDKIDTDSEKEVKRTTLLMNRTQLIQFVHERPVIWDKTLNIYKNKYLKEEAWRDICLNLNKNYERMSEIRKRDYMKLLINTWSQIRDTWFRSMKNRFSRPYKHHKKLLFLKKIINSSDVLKNIVNKDEDTEDDEDDTVEENEQSADNSCSSIKRRDEIDGEQTVYFDSHLINTTPQIETEDRNYCFFKSIQPTLANFNDDQILEFQAGTIQLLQKIKSAQREYVYNQPHVSTVQSSEINKQALPIIIHDPIKIETHGIT